MFKNPWFTLVIGLMVGLALGYVFAERQPIPPGKALRLGAPQAPADRVCRRDILHSTRMRPIRKRNFSSSRSPNFGDAWLRIRATSVSRSRWAIPFSSWPARPAIPGIGRSPGSGTKPRWPKAAATIPMFSPTSASSCATCELFDRSVEALDRAIAVEPDHWQAWFNKVIVLNFDLHDHDGAREAFSRLKEIAAQNPEVPDLTAIEAEVMGK